MRSWNEGKLLARVEAFYHPGGVSGTTGPNELCSLLFYYKKAALQFRRFLHSVRSRQGEREKNEYSYDAAERAKVIKI
jgi:hypothetical protein